MRVVWLCHFSDTEVRSRLPLSHRQQYQDYAPWIPNTLKYVADSPKLRLFVIAPHNGLKRLWYRFSKGNITYIFFKSDVPLVHRKLWQLKGLFLNNFVRDKYWWNKLVVKWLVDGIHPDLIHLQGAENPRYSSTVLQFKDKYPVVVNLQKASFDFIYEDTPRGRDTARIEKEIIWSFRQFMVRTRSMERDLLQINPQAHVHWVYFAMPELKPLPTSKEYDIVYFSRVCKEKGIEDLLAAFREVRKVLPSATLYVIGAANPGYLVQLKDIANKYGVAEGITWKGYLPTMQEVHYEASKARVSVLPAYYDVIPGTIIESMQLGIPVVSYLAGSIPELNEKRENALLVPVGDIDGLAEGILRLLSDQDLYRLMSQRGVEHIMSTYSNDAVQDQHLACYKAVVAQWKQ